METPNSIGPSESPQTIDLQFGHGWSILRPRMYRLLEKKYVDQFFIDGTLRLSSFRAFSKHKDEQRKDTQEGHGIRFASDGEYLAVVVSGRGHNSYVLCCTTNINERIFESLSFYDSCIAIDRPLEFVQAVAQELPFFRGGLEGPCIYLDDTTIKKRLKDGILREAWDKEKISNDTINTNIFPTLAQMAGGPEEYFIKNSRYSHQSEYRFIWNCKSAESEYIDIKCPSAIQFCRRIDRQSLISEVDASNQKP